MSHRRVEAENLEIADLEGVTELTVHNIKKAVFRRLTGLEALPLTALELRWISSPDLTPIPIPKTLASLTVWHSTKFKSLDGIAPAAGLKELYLRENGSPFDLSAVATLKNLDHLILDGGYGDGKRVTSLAPLEGLPITELTFVNIRGDGLDFGPVARLPALATLNLPTRLIPPEELAKVAAAKPWYLEQLTELPQASASYATRCKTCATLPHELFLKGKKWHWCMQCQKAKLDEHIANFRELVADAEF